MKELVWLQEGITQIEGRMEQGGGGQFKAEWLKMLKCVKGGAWTEAVEGTKTKIIASSLLNLSMSFVAF